MIRSIVFSAAVIFNFCVAQAQDVPLQPPGFRALSQTMADTAVQTKLSFSETQAPRAGGKKSMGLAMGMSMLIPGAGQVYNGEPVKGIVFLGLFAGGVAAVDAARIHTMIPSSITAYGWVSLVYLASVYAWNILDAPLSAKRINRELDSELQGPTGSQTTGVGNPLWAVRAQGHVVMRVSIGF
jgi:TM2 domain-containing membrane protein YozV